MCIEIYRNPGYSEKAIGFCGSFYLLAWQSAQGFTKMEQGGFLIDKWHFRHIRTSAASCEGGLTEESDTTTPPGQSD